MTKILFTIKLLSFLLLTFICQNTYSSLGGINICSTMDDIDLNSKIISKSHIIVSGTLISDVNAIYNNIETGNHIPTQLNLIQNTVIKSNVPLSDVIQIEYSTRPINLRPCSSLILTLDLTEVIVFLKPVMIDGKTKYYFEAIKTSILPSNQSALDKIINITQTQQDFLDNFETQFNIKDKELLLRVDQLIHNLAFETTQRQAILELIELDKKAVPIIIYSMDNYIKLNYNDIRVQAKNGVSKSYSPELTVDLLAIILNTITNKNFGYIYNGATDLERAQTINAWRTYLMD